LDLLVVQEMESILGSHALGDVVLAAKEQQLTVSLRKNNGGYIG